ncbi:N-acetylglucosaminyltransferase, partial [Turicibacter sanguinis]|nr:N-acetylglucosaminyltransferase [Turicibacter sanguinis]
MRNFRMAYLILAHKNSTQINMLIDALTHDKIDIFIHLDLKSTIKDEIRQCENIYFVENRTDVEWGTVSQVYAMLNSLQVIYNTNKKYDYIHLISGQDFPLNKAEDIITFFYLNNGKQFLNMWEASGFWYSRVAVYYPKILLINNSIVKIIRGIYSRI